MGMVGLAWWGCAAVAAAGCIAALFVYEGSGHEIFLEGEREMMDEDTEQEDQALLLTTTGRERLSLDTLVESVVTSPTRMTLQSPVDISEKRRERRAS